MTYMYLFTYVNYSKPLFRMHHATTGFEHGILINQYFKQTVEIRLIDEVTNNVYTAGPLD